MLGRSVSSSTEQSGPEVAALVCMDAWQYLSCGGDRDFFGSAKLKRAVSARLEPFSRSTYCRSYHSVFALVANDDDPKGDVSMVHSSTIGGFESGLCIGSIVKLQQHRTIIRFTQA